MRQRRALRQFTLSTGKSAGRNSSGRITVFHRGGGSKRLQRRIDLKRSTSSIGIVERIEYEPNRSSRIAPVRWTGGGVRQRKCKTIEEFAPPRKILESTTTTRIRREKELFQRNLLGLGAALFLLIMTSFYSPSEYLDCFGAACDGGRGSSSGALDFSPPREPEPRLPEPEVAPIPREVLVPELEQPLLPDIQRRVELQQRLSLYFIGRNEARHLPPFLGILEKQMLLEKKIEAALVRDGFPPHIVLDWRSEIRGLVFNHPTREAALSENTLNRYLSQIERDGTRQSQPYLRLVRAIGNAEILYGTRNRRPPFWPF
nr:hypothetical protein [Nicotiana tabacum]